MNDTVMYLQAQIIALRLVILAHCKISEDRSALLAAIDEELVRMKEAFIPQPLPDSLLADVEIQVASLIEGISQG